MNPTRAAAWLALAAGAMDFATGAALVGAPGRTLAVMGVPVPAPEALVFVRFVGAFVGAVGALYLWALLRPRERLRLVLQATIIPRTAAAAYVGAAIALGALPSAWVSVTATDGLLVVVQLWLLARGAGRHE